MICISQRYCKCKTTPFTRGFINTHFESPRWLNVFNFDIHNTVLFFISSHRKQTSAFLPRAELPGKVFPHYCCSFPPYVWVIFKYIYDTCLSAFFLRINQIRTNSTLIPEEFVLSQTAWEMTEVRHKTLCTYSPVQCLNKYSDPLLKGALCYFLTSL